MTVLAERRREHGHAVAARARDHGAMSVLVELEGREEILQRRRVHVRGRRAPRDTSCAAYEALQLDGTGAGPRRRLDELDRAIHVTAVIEADLGDDKHGVPAPDATAGDFKRHGCPPGVTRQSPEP